MVLFSFWAKLCALSIISVNFYALSQDKFQLRVGDEINLLSDKGYYHNNGKLIEAVGNVVIIHKTETLYGDTATFDMDKGLFHIEGNVRYITQEMTLYGSEIDYNLKTKQMTLQNVRMLNNLYSIVAKKVFRKNPNLYEFEDAEYTTCKDCPESWSVYGDKVSLTVNEYVQIKNCLIKVKGTSVLYLPYLIFPIKKGRETGLLFPNFIMQTNEGDFGFQLPFFWAVSENKDATVTPSLWGSRGYGSDLEYRHMLGDQKWFEFHTRFVDDQIYHPVTQSKEDVGRSFFRHFSDFETRFQFGQNWNSHLWFSDARDMDYVSSQFIYTENRFFGTELGLDGFLEGRSSLFNYGFEGKWGNNMLVDDPLEFDDQYVQIMPRAYLSMTPINLLRTEVPGLENISLGMRSSFVKFEQTNPIDISERQTYPFINDQGQTESIPMIRNAQRLTVEPFVNWSYITTGPLNISSRFSHRYQTYAFNERDQGNFNKSVSTLQTSMSLSFEKIFGLAYEEKIPKESIKNYEEPKQEEVVEEDIDFEARYKDQIVGKLKPFEKSLTDPYVTLVKNSYRHSTEYRLNHYYVPFEQESGNQQFRNQIANVSREGWFDYEDAIFSVINESGDNETRTDISPANTIEFQWNNSLVRKRANEFSFLEDRRYLRDNFTYNQIGFFNVSQGVELNSDETGLQQNLTRLHVNTGVTINNWSMNYSQFYFHQNGQQRVSFGVDRNQGTTTFGVDFRYDDVANRDLRLISANIRFLLLDTVQVFLNRNYDISQGEITSSQYAINYRPSNKCWVLGLNYQENLQQEGFFTVNFLMNFGGGWFGPGQNNG